MALVATTFSADLWQAGEDTYRHILRHPFLTGLADGSLEHDAFAYFITQDSHYLRAYARALALVAARATTQDAVRMFAEHASNAIAVANSDAREPSIPTSTGSCAD